MTQAFIPRAGAVFSADIAVPEHEREVRFYSRVLSTGANPLWREADLMNNRGIPIIGIGERGADREFLPLQWMPHIQVEDVAASARIALELGGVELMHSRDEGGASQWAVLQDPRGAAFGVVPIVQAGMLPPGDGEMPVAGRIAWMDLTVSNAAETRDFYQAVIGWSVQDVEIKDGDSRYADFNMIADDGTPLAGVCHARGVNVGLPGVWMIYLPVGDMEESLRRVEAEGGRIVKTTRMADGGHGYAVIEDPVGACLALVAA
jgi:predicted enzyme related to lactoylglutathione lyase